MANLPANWAQMSPKDQALWQYLNAGEEFQQGGAPQYSWQGDLGYETLGSGPQQANTGLSGITTDPALREAQIKALAAYENQAESGLSAADELALNKSSRRLASDQAANAATIQQRLASQGRAGGRLGVAMQMQAAQQAQQAQADDAAQRNVMAQQGRLAARGQAANLAGNMSAEDYRRQSAAAAAQDAINRFNTQNTTARQQYNNQLTNQAAQANWQGRQNMSNKNVDMNYGYRKDVLSNRQGNAEMQYNKANEDENRRMLEKQRKRQRTANMISGALSGAASGASGGPWGMAGGAIAGGVTGAQYYSGKVKGEAPFPGDDPRNDMFPAMLSADEIVVPREAAQDPQSAAEFAATAAQPDKYSAIKNPRVAEYLRQRDQAASGLMDAEKRQDTLAGLGNFGQTLSNNIQASVGPVHQGNSLQNLGKPLQATQSQGMQADIAGQLSALGKVGTDRARGKFDRATGALDFAVKQDQFAQELARKNADQLADSDYRNKQLEETGRHNRVSETNQRLMAAAMAAQRADTADRRNADGLEKDVQKLSDKLEGSQSVVGALTDVETLLGGKLDEFTAKDGKLSRNGAPVDLPGVSVPMLGRMSAYNGNARELDGAIGKVFNTVLKDRSGAAVTNPEMERLRIEFNSGKYNTESEMVSALQRYKKALQQTLVNREAGFKPEVVEKYRERGGVSSNSLQGASPAPSGLTPDEERELMELEAMYGGK